MNSDLTPAQDISGTNNPQGAQSMPAGNEAAGFQNSAGSDVLAQNRSLQVVTTGDPVTGVQKANDGMSGTVITLIIVTSIILLVLAGLVYRIVMKRPGPEVAKPKTKAKAEATEEPEARPVVKVTRPRGKKKPSRSKRHK